MGAQWALNTDFTCAGTGGAGGGSASGLCPLASPALAVVARLFVPPIVQTRVRGLLSRLVGLPNSTRMNLPASLAGFRSYLIGQVLSGHRHRRPAPDAQVLKS
jgi:hypothetical protein